MKYDIPEECESRSGKHNLYVEESGWVREHKVEIFNGEIEFRGDIPTMYDAYPPTYRLCCFKCDYRKTINNSFQEK